jgi:hypothetical protein
MSSPRSGNPRLTSTSSFRFTVQIVARIARSDTRGSAAIRLGRAAGCGYLNRTVPGFFARRSPAPSQAERKRSAENGVARLRDVDPLAGRASGVVVTDAVAVHDGPVGQGPLGAG